MTERQPKKNEQANNQAYIEIVGKLCLRCGVISLFASAFCQQCGRPFTSGNDLSDERAAFHIPESETRSTTNFPRAAIWRSHDGDFPVVVTKRAGSYRGRVYVNTEGSLAAVPLDEIEFPEEGNASAQPQTATSSQKLNSAPNSLSKAS